ncbi:MAG: amidohydrolase family protein [Microbacteriaceae bacterium]
MVLTTQESTGQPYLVVSSDSHAGPSLERSLRPYCPAEFLETFDDFTRGVREQQFLRRERDDQLSHADRAMQNIIFVKDEHLSAEQIEARQRTFDCPGHDDFAARLAAMDADGVAAEVIFAGGQNREVTPFVGFGADAGPAGVDPRLRAVGEQIWNRWLADACSIAPERLLGVIQVPIWDLDAAIEEMAAGRERGLTVVNLPAPRADLVPYNDPVYERFWAACEDLDMTLATHTGGGEAPLGFQAADGSHLPGGALIYQYERFWLTRRHLWQLMFGGVFDRHPKLRVVFTEQMVSWVAPTLADLDNVYHQESIGWYAIDSKPARTPSEYWATNCFNGGSFLAPHEADMRHDVGVDRLMWGTDYPHMEGTWPNTMASIRNTFAHVPEDDTRRILGENAVSAYHLDAKALRPVADRIGPTPQAVAVPLAPEEIPAIRGRAFRTFENF